MNVTTEALSPLDLCLHLTIEPGDYKPNVKKELNKIRRESHLKGFRRGTAPVGLIRKLYGQSVVARTIGDLINDSLDNYAKENELSLLGKPLEITENPPNLDLKNDIEYSFDFQLALRPKIEFNILNEQSDKVFTKYDIEVGDLVDTNIDKMRTQHGTLEETDAILEDNDMLFVKFIELNDLAEPKEEGIEVESSILFEMLKDGETKDKIKALKKEDSLVVNVFEIMERDRESIIKFVLNQKEVEDPDAIGPLFRMELNTIKSRKAADMDADFFKKITRNEEIETEEAFREFLTNDIQKQLGHSAQVRLYKEVVDHLVQEKPIDLPELYIHAQLKEFYKDQKTEEELSKDGPLFDYHKKGFKWDIIRTELAEQLEVTVEEEEIDQSFYQQIQAAYVQYIGFAPPPETIVELKKSWWQDNKRVNETYNNLLESKLASQIASKIKTDPKSISVDEFNELKPLDTFNTEGLDDNKETVAESDQTHDESE